MITLIIYIFTFYLIYIYTFGYGLFFGQFARISARFFGLIPSESLSNSI